MIIKELMEKMGRIDWLRDKRIELTRQMHAVGEIEALRLARKRTDYGAELETLENTEIEKIESGSTVRNCRDCKWRSIRTGLPGCYCSSCEIYPDRPGWCAEDPK